MKVLNVILFGALSLLLHTATANEIVGEHLPVHHPDGPVEGHREEPKPNEDPEFICRCFRGYGGSDEARVKTELVSEEAKGYPRCQCFMRVKGQEEEPVKTDYVVPKPCCTCGREEAKVEYCTEDRGACSRGCGGQGPNRVGRAPYPMERSAIHRQRCRQYTYQCPRQEAECPCERHAQEERYIFCRPAQHYQP